MSKKNLYNLLEKNKGKYAALINGIIIFLIIISIPLDALESCPGIPFTVKNIAVKLDIFISVIFLTEYILRLYACTENPKYSGKILGRIKYAFTPLMLIDLLAMPPYILLGYGHLRILRSIRILMLARYIKAVQVIESILKNKAKELAIILGFFLMLWGWSALMIFRFEHQAQPQVFKNLFDALWWSAGTFSTIGYGDMIPITVGGKIIALITMFSGPILFGLTTAVLTSGIIDRLKHAAKNRLP